MSVFRVWAPKPSNVAMRIDGRDVPMQRAPDGWWSVSCDAAGQEYQYVVDGEPSPDPRSQSQPRGVHGPSAPVDHGCFEWADGPWQPPPFSSAVIYEMHVGTFTPEGTFEAAIGKLGHLRRLGVTHVELMPVAQFAGPWGWGYDGVDLYAPHREYGSACALKRLVNACHEQGLAVLLDVVYNHLGPSGNYLDRFGPYYTTRYSTPWGAAVNLDGPGSHEVRRFICDNACMWLRDYHFDGLRIDAVHAFLDTSAVHILEQLSEEVERLQVELGRTLTLIAESDLNDPRVVRPREAGGYGIGAQWNDDFHHALHTVLTGERGGYYADFGGLEALALSLRQAFVYTGEYSPFRERPHGRRGHGIPGWKFLGYLQNHDQIGNRARGERSSHLLSQGKLRIAAALIMTAPFVPMLFQGEEWAASTPFLFFTQHEEDWLRESIREGRRREFAAFGWRPEDVPDPQDPATFERSKLQWNEIEGQPHAEVLAWYRDLIHLRRSHGELRDGRLDQVKTRCDAREEWLAMERGSFTTVCNFSAEPRAIPLAGSHSIVLASEPVQVQDGSIHLAPESVAILRRA